MTDASQSILIYGGSFDPPHRAHVELPRKIASRIGASMVLYVPAGQPPHKKGRTMTAAEHRLAMLECALHRAEDVSICRYEMQREAASYTVNTLEHFHRIWPGLKMRLLIGADMAAIFYKWRQPQRILELAEPVVMLRPPMLRDEIMARLPHDLPAEQRDAWAQRIVETDRIDISATELRLLLEQGRWNDPKLQRMLHPDVLRYIQRHHLYQG